MPLCIFEVGRPTTLICSGDVMCLCVFLLKQFAAKLLQNKPRNRWSKCCSCALYADFELKGQIQAKRPTTESSCGKQVRKEQAVHVQENQSLEIHNSVQCTKRRSAEHKEHTASSKEFPFYGTRNGCHGNKAVFELC